MLDFRFGHLSIFLTQHLLQTIPVQLTPTSQLHHQLSFLIITPVHQAEVGTVTTQPLVINHMLIIFHFSHPLFKTLQFSMF